MEEEVSKEKFKELYTKYATPNSGWTEDYWDQFYENEEGKRYFYSKPETADSTRMFIVSEEIKHRMFFLTEKAEDSFFDFPETP
jgi:hypothetical protein